MHLLTKKQFQTIEAIIVFERQYGKFPTLRKLAKELDLSYMSVYDRIKSLIRNGAVVYRHEDKGKPSPFCLSGELRLLMGCHSFDIDLSSSNISN